MAENCIPMAIRSRSFCNTLFRIVRNAQLLFHIDERSDQNSQLLSVSNLRKCTENI